MSKDKVVRAWKDEAYRASLRPEQRAAMPTSPVGDLAADLAEVDRDMEQSNGPGWTFWSYLNLCLC